MFRKLQILFLYYQYTSFPEIVMINPTLLSVFKNLKKIYARTNFRIIAVVMLDTQPIANDLYNH